MRKVLLSTIALAALTGSALAADLPSRKAAPAYLAPVSAYSWTGFYAGVEGGLDFLSAHYRGLGNGSTATGGLLGGVIGYNYELPNKFVLGLEADGGGVLGGSRNYAPINGSTNSTYFADIRGRLGYAVTDRALAYFAGGVAFGDVDTKVLGVTNNSGRTGYTLGGGVDYAFTPNWIGRLEYRYTDLGRANNGLVGKSTFENSNAVLVGLLYKFGAPAASTVVAKY